MAQKIRSILSATLILSACGNAHSPAQETLLSHTWSPATGECNEKFAKFTLSAMEFHIGAKEISSIRVLKFVNSAEHPSNVMVVFDPGDVPNVDGRPKDENLGAFLFDTSGARLKLVAEGSPTKLSRVGPNDPNARNFDLIQCG